MTVKTYPLLDFLRKYWVILVTLVALVSQGTINHYMIDELKKLKINERLVSLETKMEFLIDRINHTENSRGDK